MSDDPKKIEGEHRMEERLADQAELGVELALLAGAAANEAITDGRYEKFEDWQRNAIVYGCSIKATALLMANTPAAVAREEICAFARSAVLETLGFPPHLRQHLN